MCLKLVTTAKWLITACVLIVFVPSSSTTAIVALDSPPTSICDARLFRQTVVSVCTFQRRDVQQVTSNPYRYFYNVHRNQESSTEKAIEGERDDYDKLVFTQLGKETLFFPAQGFSAKVKRHREFALHRKCCLNGCSAMDFAGVC